MNFEMMNSSRYFLDYYNYVDYCSVYVVVVADEDADADADVVEMDYLST